MNHQEKLGIGRTESPIQGAGESIAENDYLIFSSGPNSKDTQKESKAKSMPSHSPTSRKQSLSMDILGEEIFQNNQGESFNQQ